MSQVLLTIAHLQQRVDGDCLIACAAMSLAYIEKRYSYRRLKRTLETIEGVGTPFFKIQNLADFRGVHVIYQQGTLADLREKIDQNCPCIVPVKTDDLPYWVSDVSHAVIVAGYDETSFFLNDPAISEAPVRVPIADFDLAWLAANELYAVVIEKR